ncbi:MAG: formimidoylglutamate deiminase [Bacteroidetes bacterium]|nr:MAG: formimidoylglutamate deiminase [Bacteroidota bacterium]
MKIWKFDGILQPTGWLCPAYVRVDDAGIIQAISQSVMLDEVEEETVDGYAVPGFQNAHSHAFQYAMAGRAERHKGADDFWSWREKMYALALNLRPDQVEAIAGMLYSEMLRHGYTHVAEFHYLHHDADGKPYANPAEMGERLLAAAAQTGIRITLIPVFYQRGGFGQEPTARQRRFLSADVDAYLRLWEATQKAVEASPHAHIGIGLHSLRAVEATALHQCLDSLPAHLPVHIHVAEQLKEVEDALAFWGRRPVEWLLQEVELGPRWQLVHATHLSDEEVVGIARSGAQVVLCPSTEGNLGDGRFRLQEFQQAGGRWCIGTDSHVGLSPLEELRMLDYSQRIHHHQRNIFHSPTQADSGTYAFRQAYETGRRAMGLSPHAYFEVGQPLDATVFSTLAPLLYPCPPEFLLSTMLYAGDSNYLLGTLVAGNWKMYAGMHESQLAVATHFWRCMEELEKMC